MKLKAARGEVGGGEGGEGGGAGTAALSGDRRRSRAHSSSSAAAPAPTAAARDRPLAEGGGGWEGGGGGRGGGGGSAVPVSARHQCCTPGGTGIHRIRTLRAAAAMLPSGNRAPPAWGRAAGPYGSCSPEAAVCPSCPPPRSTPGAVVPRRGLPEARSTAEYTGSCSPGGSYRPAVSEMCR